MIISHRLKYIFIHVPKTGGTSIQALLENNEEFQRDVIGHFFGAENKDFEENPLMSRDLKVHASAREIKANFDKNNIDWYEYFKFGFIRNPWDLMVSQYFYFMQQLSQQKTSDENTWVIDHYKDKPVKEFIKYICKHDIVDVFLDDLEQRKKPITVDYFGKLETIEQDIEKIAGIIDPSIQIKNMNIPKINASKRKEDYRNYYDEETMLLVKDVFKRTIDLGGYEF